VVEVVLGGCVFGMTLQVQRGIQRAAQGYLPIGGGQAGGRPCHVARGEESGVHSACGWTGCAAMWLLPVLVVSVLVWTVSLMVDTFSGYLGTSVLWRIVGRHSFGGNHCVTGMSRGI
jgi:hypothetical protein